MKTRMILLFVFANILAIPINADEFYTQNNQSTSDSNIFLISPSLSKSGYIGKHNNFKIVFKCEESYFPQIRLQHQIATNSYIIYQLLKPTSIGDNLYEATLYNIQEDILLEIKSAAYVIDINTESDVVRHSLSHVILQENFYNFSFSLKEDFLPNVIINDTKVTPIQNGNTYSYTIKDIKAKNTITITTNSDSANSNRSKYTTKSSCISGFGGINCFKESGTKSIFGIT